MNISIPTEIESALNRGARLILSMSGGKDSDAMAESLLPVIRERNWRAEILHADLGRAEWFFTPSYIERRAKQLDLPLTVVRHPTGDLLWRFQDRGEKRGKPFSSAALRFCTSDMKTGPSNKHIRAISPGGGEIVIASGLRAEESKRRAQKGVFSVRKAVTNKSRTVWDWNPIHRFSENDVWNALRTSTEAVNELRTLSKQMVARGFKASDLPTMFNWNWHVAYLLGNQRVSCSICILASRSDIMNGIEWNPEFYRQMVALEQKHNFAFRKDLWLSSLRPDLLSETQNNWYAQKQNELTDSEFQKLNENEWNYAS